ncbi:hypothetical protein [Candidatus Palauibacter sp.]|uniref:hypothetical protein n=1 Tax=Candidatus Palauibacter sp. TaxID=3101350 RepID=UPI003AF207D2
MRKQRDVVGRWLRPLRGLVGVLIVLGIVLTEEGCSNDTDVAGIEPRIEAPSLAEALHIPPVTNTDIGTLIGPDKRFNEIAKSVPEFGGYWMDAGGNMVVALTDLTKQTAVANITRTELQNTMGPGGSIRYEQVTYGFNRLLGWRESLTGRLHARSDVAFLDIDQESNKTGCRT